MLLRVTDGAGNSHIDTMEIEVVDIQTPIADAGPDDSVDEDAPYIFDGSGSTDDVDIVNYSWDMDNIDGLDWVTPDQSGPTLWDPVHTYYEPGVYVATLRVSDAYGNWDTDTVFITVLDVTSPAADAGSPATIDEDTSHQQHTISHDLRYILKQI